MYFLRNLQRTTLNRNLNDYLRQHFISVIVTVIFIFLFIGFNLHPDRGSLACFAKWGSPSIDDIRDGKLWGLLTTNLLEPDLLFLLFSLGWLWNLGRYIEQRVSSLFYLWLIISSCILASVMQMAVFGDLGYGFGAVVFSMFGFIWVRSMSEPSRWSTQPGIEIQLLLWVVICFVINYTGIYKIAYGGYFFGFIWGALLAHLATLRNRGVRIATPLLLLGLCSISIFWAPWSVAWLNYEADKYHKLKDFNSAKNLYLRILEKDPNNEIAKKNLQSIRHWEMSKEAFGYVFYKDYDRAKSLYSRILEEDPNNEEVKENLQRIKIEAEDDTFQSDEKVSEARNRYLEILKTDPNNEIAKKNLQSIRLWEMSQEASKLYLSSKFSEARNICLEILRIEPDDDWAKSCVDRLPAK